MKFRFFIVAVVAMFTMGSCGWLGLKQAEEGTEESAEGVAVGESTENADAETSEEAERRRLVEKLLVDWESPIRPGEKLRPEATYTDDFEYVQYSDGGDFCLFVVRKPGGNENILLFDSYCYDTPAFNRGDRVRVEWKIDVAHEIGEGGRPYMAEFATGMTKTADGPLTRFRKRHPEKMQYVQRNGWDPEDESEIERARERYTDDYYYGAVEYCVAVSSLPEVTALVADRSAVIRYTAWEDELGGTRYDFFEVWNENDTPGGELPDRVAWFCMVDTEPPRLLYEEEPESAYGDAFMKLAYY